MTVSRQYELIGSGNGNGNGGRNGKYGYVGGFWELSERMVIYLLFIVYCWLEPRREKMDMNEQVQGLGGIGLIDIKYVSA